LWVIQLLFVIVASRASSFRAFDPFGAVPEPELTMAGLVICQLAPRVHESSLSDHWLPEDSEGVFRPLLLRMDLPGYLR
jgi:hypothetical protein